ncbi:MAG TPA: hypothetical protein VJQ56_00180 [Blastocatellia bacterium]|nr:hypothetical protein [Blastocatellia bacterium]
MARQSRPEPSSNRNGVIVEITGRDEFWQRAFHVEWEYQFPDRKLSPTGRTSFRAQAAWLDDLDRVGRETFCRVERTPASRERRRWLGALLARPVERRRR